MTHFIAQPNIDGLVKLSGTIEHYKKTRGYASFIFAESDQMRLNGEVVESTKRIDKFK